MQFFRRKRYHFFYPAGLISLVLLPLLGYLYLRSQKVFDQKYIIEINAWSADMIEYFPSPTPLRKYSTVKFDGNNSTDIQKLEEINLKVQGLITKKDTLDGIHLKFAPKAKYSTLISALNICLKEDLRDKRLAWSLYKQQFMDFIFKSETCLL